MSNPTISDAKALAYKHRATQVIILHFTQNDDSTVYGVTSYGMTREKCDEAAGVANHIFDLVADPEAWATKYLRAIGYTVTK